MNWSSINPADLNRAGLTDSQFRAAALAHRGLSQRDIAQLLGVSRPSVQTLLRRAWRRVERLAP